MDGLTRVISNGVRRATQCDVLDMVRIAQRAYATLPVDWGSVAAWLSQNIEKPEMFGCISGDAASIAIQQDWFWRPGVPEVTLLFLAGNVWDSIRCLRATAAWGRALGAENFKVDAETGTDLAPLIKRTGFMYNRVPAYTVRLH